MDFRMNTMSSTRAGRSRHFISSVVWAGSLLGAGVACMAAAGSAPAQPAAGQSPGGLRAGFARADITPGQPVLLAGYASRKELSQGVHDPLSARVAVFAEGGRSVVLVSTDLIGYYGETSGSMRQAILEACGLEPEELFLTAIHTHGGPQLGHDPSRLPPSNVEYTRWLEGRLIETVGAARSRLAPAQVASGSGACPVGVNRREPVRDKDGKPSIVLGRNPLEPVDREVQVLRIAGADGSARAVLFAYPTHSTAMGPRNLRITGDVHGIAEQFLETYLGNGLIAAAFAGASGNIDPWFRVLPEFRAERGWVPEAVLLGTFLGEEAARVIERVPAGSADGPVRSVFRTLRLPGKPRNEEAAPADHPPTELNVTVGRVGEVAWVGLGGEIFNEIGSAIKAASPFRMTVVVTHCNGAAGYLPIAAAYPQGGYEVRSSPFAPGAAEQLVSEAARMLNEIRDGR